MNPPFTPTASATHPPPLTLRTDTLADQALATLLYRWDATQPQQLAHNQATIRQLFALLKQMPSNHELGNIELPAALQALTPLLQEANRLPDWARPDLIERGQQVFRSNGVVSGIIFYCACMPESYVLPDIASALHASGNLQAMTEQRLHATSAMVFSVLLPGGLDQDSGAGRCKMLKARLVHALMRHLLLRGPVLEQQPPAPVARLPAWPSLSGQQAAMLAQVLAHGWNPVQDGLPCNQEELGYILLTFSYVYLRSLRRLGFGHSRADEEAYLHFWNVTGHFFGIQRAVMADTMQQAETLFQRWQQAATAQTLPADPRPLLTQALLVSLEKLIPHKTVRVLVSCMVAFLTGKPSYGALGLGQRLQWFGRIALLWFRSALFISTRLDRLLGKIHPGLSLMRSTLRIVGYQLIRKNMDTNTTPIDLPPQVQQQINQLVEEWENDPRAPDWLNRLVRFFTSKGSWRQSIGV